MSDTATDIPVINEAPTLPGVNPVLHFDASKLGLALVPFTPVSFTGQEGVYAWGRLALYGGIAMLAYKKSPKVAVVFGAAAGLCVLTSLAGNSWRK